MTQRIQTLNPLLGIVVDSIMYSRFLYANAAGGRSRLQELR